MHGGVAHSHFRKRELLGFLSPPPPPDGLVMIEGGTSAMCTPEVRFSPDIFGSFLSQRRETMYVVGCPVCLSW